MSTTIDVSTTINDRRFGVAPAGPARFTGLMRSELTKVISTRLWWILAIILFAYVALSAGGAAFLFGDPNGMLAAQSNAPEAGQIPPGVVTQLVYSFGSSIGYVFPVLFGAIAATTEFRHQTLTPTFLATPKRGRVLVAKAAVLTLFGAGFGVVAMLASVGVGAAVLAALGTDPLLGHSDTWALIGRAVLAMALWSLIGVGLGVLVPSQVAAIVIVLAFTQFVEPILRLAAGTVDWTAEVGKYLPGAASDALVGASFYSLMGSSSASLDWWQGGIVLLAIGVVACLIGGVTTWKRDVT